MPWIVVLFCLLFAGDLAAQKWTIQRGSDPLMGTISIVSYLGFSHGYLGENQHNRITSYINKKNHTKEEILASGERPWETNLIIKCASIGSVGKIVVAVSVIAQTRYFISSPGESYAVWRFSNADVHRERLTSRYSIIAKSGDSGIGSHTIDVPILLADFSGHKNLQFRIEKGPVMPKDWTVTFDLSRSEPVIKEVLGMCGGKVH